MVWLIPEADRGPLCRLDLHESTVRRLGVVRPRGRGKELKPEVRRQDLTDTANQVTIEGKMTLRKERLRLPYDSVELADQMGHKFYSWWVT